MSAQDDATVSTLPRLSTNSPPPTDLPPPPPPTQSSPAPLGRGVPPPPHPPLCRLLGVVGDDDCQFMGEFVAAQVFLIFCNKKFISFLVVCFFKTLFFPFFFGCTKYSGSGCMWQKC